MSDVKETEEFNTLMADLTQEFKDAIQETEKKVVDRVVEIINKHRCRSKIDIVQQAVFSRILKDIIESFGGKNEV